MVYHRMTLAPLCYPSMAPSGNPLISSTELKTQKLVMGTFDYQHKQWLLQHHTCGYAGIKLEVCIIFSPNLIHSLLTLFYREGSEGEYNYKGKKHHIKQPTPLSDMMELPTASGEFTASADMIEKQTLLSSP